MDATDAFNQYRPSELRFLPINGCGLGLRPLMCVPTRFRFPVVAEVSEFPLITQWRYCQAHRCHRNAADVEGCSFVSLRPYTAMVVAPSGAVFCVYYYYPSHVSRPGPNQMCLRGMPCVLGSAKRLTKWTRCQSTHTFSIHSENVAQFPQGPPIRRSPPNAQHLDRPPPLPSGGGGAVGRTNGPPIRNNICRDGGGRSPCRDTRW